jgi:uncharacterized protein YqjF (DUF2071 family)
MVQGWRSVSFLHWTCPAPALRRLLPEGIELDTYDGRAWVGLIPLLMDDVRPLGVSPAPWLSRFPETNVRTYVRGPDGEPAIWFFSLDAARFPAVAAARIGYGLRYYWSAMSVSTSDGVLRYRSRRRWPGPHGARCEVDLALGDPRPPAEPGSLSDFLTARYRLYSTWGGRTIAADAWHRPWPLREATVLGVRQDLISAAGLPAPSGPPLVHHSPGVGALVGLWYDLEHLAAPQ